MLRDKMTNKVIGSGSLLPMRSTRSSHRAKENQLLHFIRPPSQSSPVYATGELGFQIGWWNKVQLSAHFSSLSCQGLGQAAHVQRLRGQGQLDPFFLKFSSQLEKKFFLVIHVDAVA